MATSSSILTAEQQSQLANWTGAVRASEAAFAKYILTITALNAAYNVASGASSLMALLQAGDVIDDKNQLAGSGPMSKQDVIDRVADMQSLIAAWPLATYLPLWTKAAGPGNVLP
jgi:cell division protein ZapA (FtsZ GTPase activity inhibitor)